VQTRGRRQPLSLGDPHRRSRRSFGVSPPKTGDQWGFNLNGKQTVPGGGWMSWNATYGDCWNATYGDFHNPNRFGVLTFGK